MVKPLNIFYQEPDADRWFKYDHYPRKIIRRIVRGKERPGGVMMVAINLMKGMDKIGVPYRFNDFSYIKKHPEEIACIIGKPQVLFDKKWVNPIIFGAGVFSHPIDCPGLLKAYPNVKRVLVPGDWIKQMFIPYYGDKTISWPVGIDTQHWNISTEEKRFDFLIYDKIRWQYQQQKKELIDPITNLLDEKGVTYQFIKYGNYSPSELSAKLKNSRSVIFLCEHETQGLAYQQILSTNTPVLAWERGGYWQDPSYYPDRVKYQPVSAVPYWDERCGLKFANANALKDKLSEFLARKDEFKPREFILENLTLEICAEKYLTIYKEVEQELI